ncbi:helix-turn-helix domain-containing protein [Actinoplanes sp. NPDC049265]|uniref:helix-turn-helix domain-containing protein n=1 Tax=Actinoplanes sp. NPDC049265 TaxID=3363902 RepID=UPI003721EA29
MSDERRELDPVTAFCTELRHLTQRSSLSATAAARRLHISRSQYYAVINGSVRRPPDWAKVEGILHLCQQPGAAVAAWRQRHDTMVLEYDRLRTESRTAPPDGPAQADAPPDGPAPTQADGPAPTQADGVLFAEGTAREEDRIGSSPAARRASRWRVGTIAAATVLLAAAGTAAVRAFPPGASDNRADPPPPSTGPAGVLPSLAADGTLEGPRAGAAPETENPDDPDERKACVSDPPPPGTELLAVPRQHRPGNNKMNHDWWGSTVQISFNAANPAAFDANVATGGEQVWDAIILHSCVPLVAGHRYVLRFSAATNPAGPVMVRVQDSVDPEANESVTRTLDFTPRPTPRTIEFTARHTSRSSELTFQVGGWNTPFRLRATGISLTEKA